MGWDRMAKCITIFIFIFFGVQQFSLIFFDQILGDGRDKHLPKGEQLSKRKRSRQVHWSPMGWRPLLVTNRNRHTAPIWSRLVSIHLTPCIWHLFKCQDGGLPSLCYHHAAVSLSLSLLSVLLLHLLFPLLCYLSLAQLSECTAKTMWKMG